MTQQDLIDLALGVSALSNALAMLALKRAFRLHVRTPHVQVTTLGLDAEMIQKKLLKLKRQRGGNGLGLS